MSRSPYRSLAYLLFASRRATIVPAIAIWMAVAAAQAVANDPIVIAVAGPIASAPSGSSQATLSPSASAVSRTERIVQSARRFADSVNASGGLLGRTVTVITADDGCERSRAEKVARDFVSQNVALVLGHTCINAALAAASIYATDKRLFIATAMRHPALTRKRAGQTIFRLDGRDDSQGIAAGRFLSRAARAGPVAIVHDRTAYARALADAAEATVKRIANVEPITATIVGGDKDYPLVIRKVQNAKAIFFAGFPMEAGFLFTGLRGAGSTATFLGSDSLATSELATTFAADVKGMRVLVASAAALQPDGDTSSSSISESDTTDAALLAFAESVRASASTDPLKLAAALSDRMFATRLGPIRFNSSGDADIPAFDILEWTGTAWSHTEPASQ